MVALRWLVMVAAVLLTAHAAAAVERRAVLAPGEPVVDVFDLEVLGRLESEGFSLGAVLGDGRSRSTAQLRRASPAYRAVMDVVGADVRALRDDMARNGRPLHEVTDANVGRVIDLAWLDAEVSRFSLIAVVNRIDRRDFADDPAASCGEARLIYRLRYELPATARRPQRASRLPFNLNVVFDLPSDGRGCRTIARAWVPDIATAEARDVAGFLLGGALLRERLRLARLEINAQIVRFPSGMERTFGGQAVYLLRSFDVEGEGHAVRARPRPLENTPDPARLAANDALRRALIDHLRGAAPAIDAGVYRAPVETLAERALSFSTFGSARLANRPFSTVLRDGDLTDVAWPGRLVRSGRGAIERLDQMSCAGCHQAQATAGFHVFGFDDDTTSPLNVVQQAASPHYYADRVRRRAYVAALAAGVPPNRFRPLASAPPADWNGPAPAYRPAAVTMACVPGADTDLAGLWPCDTGSQCRVLAHNDRIGVAAGQCVRPGEDRLFSGHACLTGAIETGAQPYLDRLRITGRFNSPSPSMSRTAYNCRPPHLGVPGGIAYRQCTDAERSLANVRPGAPPPDEVCAFVGGRAFDDCVATQDFAACLGRSVVRGNRTSCGGTRMCREDYICQALPPDIAGLHARDVGFCTPTYFMFQMRIDNHPSPRAR
jgi:hypothetical protein